MRKQELCKTEVQKRKAAGRLNIKRAPETETMTCGRPRCENPRKILDAGHGGTVSANEKPEQGLSAS